MGNLYVKNMKRGGKIRFLYAYEKRFELFFLIKFKISFLF